MHFTIYHNPRCSKSRETLALLRARGIEPRIIEYLRLPPSPEEIRALLKALALPAATLLRKNEAPYKTLGLAEKTLDEAFLIQAMASHPILIERPIVVRGDRAVMGRPPENVLTLLDESGKVR